MTRHDMHNGLARANLLRTCYGETGVTDFWPWCNEPTWTHLSDDMITVVHSFTAHGEPALLYSSGLMLIQPSHDPGTDSN